MGETVTYATFSQAVENEIIPSMGWYASDEKIAAIAHEIVEWWASVDDQGVINIVESGYRVRPEFDVSTDEGREAYWGVFANNGLDVLEVQHCSEDMGDEPDSFKAWLVREGETIGYLKGSQSNDEFNEEVFCLNDIETREGYRNMGVAGNLVKLAKNYFGVNNIVCSGEFTPDGFDYLRHKFEVKSGFKSFDSPVYEPMSFVEDWDNRMEKCF